ncbi:MAG TPA: hypothetical protein VJ327_03075 [Patescibacteria group bacterium]|nr:hypothetical protein [Patescibacteria group bacterium]
MVLFGDLESDDVIARSATYQSLFTNSNPTFSAVTCATVDTGQGANELHDLDQALTTTSDPTFGAITCTTIDTGQGATEVHLMNQNLRTTDPVTFGAITCTSIDTGLGANEVPVYTETTHDSTWTSTVWSDSAGNPGDPPNQSVNTTFRIRKIGKTVTLEFPSLSEPKGTNPATGPITLTTVLPAAYCPRYASSFLMLVISNNAYVMGTAAVTAGGAMTLYAGIPFTSFGITNNAGIYGTSISYTTA